MRRLEVDRTDITADVRALGQDDVNPDLKAPVATRTPVATVPICDAKLVTVAGGRSMPAGFSMFTDVPIPTKFYGLVNDDLNVNVDRRSILLGEVAPASNVPVGVYDENGNWKLTAHSDVNGFYEILLPSMDTYNCPLPAGPCANVYRLVGNDPGTLAHRNTDYNPQFRTIATEFQAWTGVVHPVDQAPTHNGITIEGPAAQFGALSLCKLATQQPDAVRHRPAVLRSCEPQSGEPERRRCGQRQYSCDALHDQWLRVRWSRRRSSTRLAVPGIHRGHAGQSWTDTQITFNVPTSLTPGPYQLQDHRPPTASPRSMGSRSTGCRAPAATSTCAEAMCTRSLRSRTHRIRCRRR